MLCDLHVLESGDMMLLDVPGTEVSPIADRLEQFHFSEDVQIATLDTLRSVWVHGPSAARLLGHEEYNSWAQYQNARVELAGAPVVVARIDQLGVPGFVMFAEAQQHDEVTRAIAAAGALHATPATLEAARIEARYPVFGIDMTPDTIPLEAGIEDRAISLTKGCYVGQEVIIRVLHRGHGRVARKLARLQIEGAPPSPNAKVFAGDREIGFVTSSAQSPPLGAIALGYLHRDFLTPGTGVEVDLGDSRTRAVVS
jgi:folate-binding protein YgfZ